MLVSAQQLVLLGSRTGEPYCLEARLAYSHGIEASSMVSFKLSGEMILERVEMCVCICGWRGQEPTQHTVRGALLTCVQTHTHVGTRTRTGAHAPETSFTRQSLLRLHSVLFSSLLSSMSLLKSLFLPQNRFHDLLPNLKCEHHRLGHAGWRG